MTAARAFAGAFVLLVVLFSPPLSSAQLTTGEIVGRVTDASGATIPGSTVTARNTQTNISRSTVTSDTGDYVINLLTVGTYAVTIELQGFQSQTSQVSVRSGERVRLDGRLALGTIAESVQVTAEAPLLQTETAALSTLVTEKAVQDLPVVGRNFMRLVQFVPGANEGTVNALGSGTRPDDRRQTSAVSINGAADNQNNQMIDGLDNNERYIGTIGVKPSLDAIEEVRVQTNLYSAESGRTGGGIINIITKSGTNAIRGSLYEFARNDRFDERDYFATTDPILKQHQFGGSIGGPVVPGRTFFFGDYERFRQTKGQVNLLTVPTARMRVGDFSESGQIIYDPLTSPRVPFAGNIIPAGRIDPVAARFMALFPMPTSAGAANNYASTTIGSQYSHTADARIDHRFNDNNSMFARYSFNDLDNYTPSGCPATTDGIYPGCLTGTNAGFPGPNDTRASAFQVNYVRVFSPSLIAEVKGGTMNVDIKSYPANYGTNPSQRLGLPGVNVDDIASALAIVNVVGFAILGDTQNIPLFINNKNRQVNATMTKTAGAHSIKFGGGVILRKFSSVQSASPNGIFTFNNTLTRSSTNTGGNSVASFLLGYPTNVSRTHTPFEPWYHTNEPGIFVQDDWRATSSLTVNIGARYDVFTPFTEEQDRMANIDLETGQILVAGQNGVSSSAGVKTDYTNFAPRLGFAWTATPTTVVRGGYGLAFFPSSIASFSLGKNPPLFSIYAPPDSLGATGGAPTIFFRDGLPVPAVPTTTPTAVQLTGAYRAVDPDLRSTRVQQFNIQVEREISGNVVAAGYVGSRGDFIAAFPNVNLAPVGSGVVQPRRRYASRFPGLTNINLFQSIYENSYDAVQITFQRRLRAGLSFNAFYTRSLSKLTQSTTWDPVDTLEWVSSVNDVPHAWMFQANYALPWGQSLTGPVGVLVSGWQVNAIAFWQSGRPFVVTNAAERGNTGGADRPNMVGDPMLPEDQRTLHRWFNTDAFVLQPQFSVGNAPSFVGHGPPQRRLDLSVFKDFSLTERARLQLRYEVYNLTNTPSFQPPSGVLGTPAFGSITSTGNAIPRQMQFAAKLLF